MFALSDATFAGSISSDSGPDPILMGEPPGPCAAGTAGADYVAGVDATGQPVAPADTASRDVLGSNHVLVTVPLKNRAHGEATVDVDLAKLAPPSCAPQARRR